MPDICDLILDDHETFRRRFAELDEHRDADTDRLARLWTPLAGLLDRHAAAEEAVFYPLLLKRGTDGEDETDDAIGDHNDIRDAVRDADNHQPGTDGWWDAVARTREHNSDHMAEEEREALADFRARTSKADREDLGARFVEFMAAHPDRAHVSTADKDPGTFIDQHTSG